MRSVERPLGRHERPSVRLSVVGVSVRLPSIRFGALATSLLAAAGLWIAGCSDDCPTDPDMTFRIAIDPADVDLIVGEEIDLSIRIDNVAALFGARCVVTFPEAFLEADSLAGAVGDLLSFDAIFLGLGDVGKVSVGVTEIQTTATDGVTGSGVLATVRLRAVAEGIGTLALTEVSMIDENGQSLPAMDDLVIESAQFAVTAP